jgi:hypothetical protein
MACLKDIVDNCEELYLDEIMDKLKEKGLAVVTVSTVLRALSRHDLKYIHQKDGKKGVWFDNKRIS